MAVPGLCCRPGQLHEGQPTCPPAHQPASGVGGSVPWSCHVPRGLFSAVSSARRPWTPLSSQGVPCSEALFRLYVLYPPCLSCPFGAHVLKWEPVRSRCFSLRSKCQAVLGFSALGSFPLILKLCFSKRAGGSVSVAEHHSTASGNSSVLVSWGGHRRRPPEAPSVFGLRGKSFHPLVWKILGVGGPGFQ